MRQMQFLFAGVEVGPFSEEQVSRYLQQGYISLSDMAKDEGETEWSELRVILAKSPRPEVESVPVSSTAFKIVKMETGSFPPMHPAKASVPNRKIVSLSSLARVTDKIPAFGPDNKPRQD